MVSGVSVQVSGVSKKMTGDRKQNSDKVLHLPVFTTCLLSSDFDPLTPDTRHLKPLILSVLLNRVKYSIING